MYVLNSNKLFLPPLNMCLYCYLGFQYGYIPGWLVRLTMVGVHSYLLMSRLDVTIIYYIINQKICRYVIIIIT